MNFYKIADHLKKGPPHHFELQTCCFATQTLLHLGWDLSYDVIFSFGGYQDLHQPKDVIPVEMHMATGENFATIGLNPIHIIESQIIQQWNAYPVIKEGSPPGQQAVADPSAAGAHNNVTYAQLGQVRFQIVGIEWIVHGHKHAVLFCRMLDAGAKTTTTTLVHRMMICANLRIITGQLVGQLPGIILTCIIDDDDVEINARLLAGF